MATTSKNILSGARGILKLNGAKVGVCTGASLNQNIGYERVNTLDLLEAYEFVEVSYNCSLTVDTVRVVGQSPTQLGFFPHIDLLSILTQPKLLCELYDAVTGQLIAVVEEVKPQDNNFTINAGAVVANNLTFVCIRQKDVSEANPTSTTQAPSSGLGSGATV